MVETQIPRDCMETVLSMYTTKNVAEDGQPAEFVPEPPTAEAMARAIAEEREVCAKVAESLRAPELSMRPIARAYERAAQTIAQAIRERNQ